MMLTTTAHAMAVTTAATAWCSIMAVAALPVAVHALQEAHCAPVYVEDDSILKGGEGQWHGHAFEWGQQPLCIQDTHDHKCIIEPQWPE